MKNQEDEGNAKKMKYHPYTYQSKIIIINT